MYEILYFCSFLSDDNLVNWHVDELDEESNEAHDEKGFDAHRKRILENSVHMKYTRLFVNSFLLITDYVYIYIRICCSTYSCGLVSCT